MQFGHFRQAHAGERGVAILESSTFLEESSKTKYHIAGMSACIKCILMLNAA